MKVRIDKIPMGTLVDTIPQPDGSVLETYEVEILGKKCRYFHIPEYTESAEFRCLFTQTTIILN